MSALKGVERGIFPLYPSEAPRPPYGARSLAPLSIFRNMHGTAANA